MVIISVLLLLLAVIGYISVPLLAKKTPGTANMERGTTNAPGKDA